MAVVQNPVMNKPSLVCSPTNFCYKKLYGHQQHGNKFYNGILYQNGPTLKEAPRVLTAPLEIKTLD